MPMGDVTPNSWKELVKKYTVGHFFERPFPQAKLCRHISGVR